MAHAGGLAVCVCVFMLGSHVLCCAVQAGTAVDNVLEAMTAADPTKRPTPEKVLADLKQHCTRTCTTPPRGLAGAPDGAVVHSSVSPLTKPYITEPCIKLHVQHAMLRAALACPPTQRCN